MLLVVLLGGLAVTDCVSIRTFVNVEPTQVAIQQDSLTKVKKKAMATSAAPVDLPAKITNASAEPIVIPFKTQIETSRLSHETAPSFKSMNSSALNKSHSNDDLSWLWPPKDNWHVIVGAILGALIVIWLTMLHFETEKEKLRKKCLEQLKTCMQFNLVKLRQAKEQIERNDIPNYQLETSQFNHWLSLSHDTLSSELLRALDWHRCQLDHLSSRFVEVASAIADQAGATKTALQIENEKALVVSLSVQVGRVIGELVSLLAKLPNDTTAKSGEY
jgi:hypothetical protein